MQDTVKGLVNNFFTGLGISIQSINVELIDKDINIALETPDSPLIIGMHGANLSSFQHLIGRMIEKQAGHFVHVHLEVNDYMKAKDERLFRFLDSKIAFVTSTGKSSKIPNLTSYERKKAHNYISLKNIIGLSTHSEGEGSERVLAIEYTGAIAPSVETKATGSSQVDELSEDGIGI